MSLPKITAAVRSLEMKISEYLFAVTKDGHMKEKGQFLVLRPIPV